MAYKWPDLREVTYGNFYYWAVQYCWKYRDIDRAWMRLVKVVKRAVYNLSNAQDETLTYGEIAEVVANGRGQFRHISDDCWKIILMLGWWLASQIPSYRSQARSHEMLQAFVVSIEMDPRSAARIWRVVVQEGLGISHPDASLVLPYWVSKSVIRDIAASKPEELPGLGDTLVPIFQAWCKTF